MTPPQVVPVVMDVELPAGMAGPEPTTFGVRCFLVPHGDGVTLVDTGIQTDAKPIADALMAMGAGWDDLSDVVLTHAHPDHCGALSTVELKAPSAAIWGGSGDTFPAAARPTEDGTLIHGFGSFQHLDTHLATSACWTKARGSYSPATRLAAKRVG